MPLPASGARYGSAKRLTIRVRIDQAAPAAAVERRPLAFGLRQTIGHRIDDGGMVAHAAMAALDPDVLGAGGWRFHAALPRADAIGAAEDRGGRHRRGWRKLCPGTPIPLLRARGAPPPPNPPTA